MQHIGFRHLIVISNQDVMEEVIPEVSSHAVLLGGGSSERAASAKGLHWDRQGAIDAWMASAPSRKFDTYVLSSSNAPAE